MNVLFYQKIQKIPDIVWSPVVVAILMAIAGFLGFLFDEPWLFPSLGPTAFLQAQKPKELSSRFYNTLVGHLIGIIMGIVVILILRGDFGSSAFEPLPASSICAAILAVSLTM